MSILGKSASGELNGFLDSGCTFQGELEFEQTFRIDGHFRGKIRSAGDLIVGQKGEVEGEIDVGRAVLAGKVRGEVRASRKVEIQSGARIEGEITTPVLLVQEGARFDGHCKMERPASGETAAPVPAETKAVAGPQRLTAVKGRSG